MKGPQLPNNPIPRASQESGESREGQRVPADFEREKVRIHVASLRPQVGLVVAGIDWPHARCCVLPTAHTHTWVSIETHGTHI